MSSNFLGSPYSFVPLVPSTGAVPSVNVFDTSQTTDLSLVLLSELWAGRVSTWLGDAEDETCVEGWSALMYKCSGRLKPIVIKSYGVLRQKFDGDVAHVVL